MPGLIILNILTDWQWFALIILVFAAGRYILLAGSAYYIFYKRGFNHLRSYKIQPNLPKQKQIRNELLYSLFTVMVFSSVGFIAYLLYMHGYTTIYLKVSDHGWIYFFFSLILLIIVHDTYFYWTHRLLHTKWLFKRIHSVHHRSVNPTPWAAYSFHPLEAFLESLIVFPFITFFPIHIAVFLFFTFIVLLMNVIGHLGYELLPRWFRNNGLGRQLTSSTHHNLHHQKSNKNFGYYFTFWDKLMNTAQPSDEGERT
jgi:Delta7-sterol 5-desaturase